MERKDVDGLGGTINFSLNQRRIADNLGLSLAHTNNTIRKRYKLGLHDLVGGQLRLRNTKALVQLAHYYDSAPKKVLLL